MGVELILFLLIAALAIASATLMILQRNPVKSVLLLILNFFCLSVAYLSLGAQFIAVIQVLIYAGAIMVLFLFVIMLLSLGEEKTPPERFGRKWFAFMLAGVVLAEILGGVMVPFAARGGRAALGPDAARLGTVEYI